jgi:hypothetical protein
MERFRSTQLSAACSTPFAASIRVAVLVQGNAVRDGKGALGSGGGHGRDSDEVAAAPRWLDFLGRSRLGGVGPPGQRYGIHPQRCGAGSDGSPLCPAPAQACYGSDRLGAGQRAAGPRLDRSRGRFLLAVAVGRRPLYANCLTWVCGTFAFGNAVTAGIGLKYPGLPPISLLSIRETAEDKTEDEAAIHQPSSVRASGPGDERTL